MGMLIAGVWRDEADRSMRDGAYRRGGEPSVIDVMSHGDMNELNNSRIFIKRCLVLSHLSLIDVISDLLLCDWLN